MTNLMIQYHFLLFTLNSTLSITSKLEGREGRFEGKGAHPNIKCMRSLDCLFRSKRPSLVISYFLPHYNSCYNPSITECNQARTTSPTKHRKGNIFRMEQRVETREPEEQAWQITQAQEIVRTALQTTYGLTLLNSVLSDNAGQAVLDLLRTLTAAEPEPVAIAAAYTRAFRELARTTYEETTPALADAWQAYLVARLIDDHNLWSQLVEREHTTQMTPALHAQIQRDLRALQRLFQLDAETLWKLTCALIAPTLPTLRDAWVPWIDLAPALKADHRPRVALAYRIAESSDWTELIAPLEHYWSRHGTGSLARYRVLRWLSQEQQLTGIAHADNILLTGLIGQQRQQQRLTTNIEHFLAGLPAQDMLLYGAPGTGKSSTIKALVNTYAEQGLRLVEVRKEDLTDLSRITALLCERAPHFLVFIDDLSFEEHETAYKALKVLLEGTAEARPANVLICATTNRLNLVRENFSERGKPTDDVHWRDSMDEKFSLVHRFGLRVTFNTPDQEQYLQIATNVARQRGITLPEETLRTRALQWEHQHVGRSGRLARQFVDELEAELHEAARRQA